MNVNGAFFLPPPASGAAFADLRSLGVTVGRADTFWTSIEPAPGVFQWGYTDARVSELAVAGIRWQPILDYSTSWASSIRGADKAAPRDPSAFADFAARLA